MCHARRGDPKTPFEATGTNLDCMFVKKPTQIILNFNKIKNRIELVTRPWMLQRCHPMLAAQLQRHLRLHQLFNGKLEGLERFQWENLVGQHHWKLQVDSVQGGELRESHHDIASWRLRGPACRSSQEDIQHEDCGYRERK